MEYSREFIKKVKKEYPNRKDLHKKLEMGDIRVGSHLSEVSMDPDKVVRAFQEGRQEDVKNFAEKCVRRKRLHAEWGKLNADWWKRKLALSC